MSSNDIFIGTIRICTDYYGETYKTADGTDLLGFELKSEIYKENAILYKTKNGRYVDIDNINSVLDNIKINRHVNTEKLGILMPISAYEENCLYVDKSTLKPYYRDELIDFSIKKLKKELRK